MTTPTLRFQIIAPALACVFVLANSAGAQCPTPVPLTSGSPVTVFDDDAVWSVTPSGNRWSAVGVRQNDGFTWSIDSFDDLVPFPVCYSGPLEFSGGSGINFLVTDWRHRETLQNDYVRAFVSGGGGVEAQLEYEQTTYEEFPNRFYDQVTFSSSNVITVLETELFADAPHIIEFWTSPGVTGLKWYLFAPQTSGSAWASPDQALEAHTLVEGGNGFNITPSVTGHYGIVVTNENAETGDFRFIVKRCPNQSNVLFDNVPFFSSMLWEWPSFTPPGHRWGVVGVRGNNGYQYGLDLAPDLRDQYTLFNLSCTDTVLASQYSGLGTKLIAGDFRSLPLRVYSAAMNAQTMFSFDHSGYIEFEDAQDLLVVNAPATPVNPGPNNVIDAFEVELIEGGTYLFTVVPNEGATANYRWTVFGNPSPGTEYWATRPDGFFDVDFGSGGFTAGVSGTYCVVVMNENNGTGGYTVRVTSDLTGAETPLPVANRIRSIAPNPSAGDMRIDYELARAGEVSVRVTNAAGRSVAKLVARAERAGPGTLVWDGRSTDGTRPVAGVYFVTLCIDDVAQDRRKTIVLR